VKRWGMEANKDLLKLWERDGGIARRKYPDVNGKTSSAHSNLKFPKDGKRGGIDEGRNIYREGAGKAGFKKRKSRRGPCTVDMRGG